MQNRNKRLLQFVKEKGYYIVLGLCVIAVGASGYLFIRTQTKKPQEKLSVPATLATEPSAGRPAVQVEGSDAALPVLKPDDTAQAAQSGTAATVVPIAAPLDGETLQCYALDRLVFNVTTQDWRTHRGLDLAAAEGQSVHAAADGTVYAVLEDDELGKTVVLRHVGGYTTQYANLAADVAVAVGQTVRCGDTLGVVGRTALLEVGSAPHLHFEVFRNNVPQDPAEFLKMGGISAAGD